MGGWASHTESSSLKRVCYFSDALIHINPLHPIPCLPFIGALSLCAHIHFVRSYNRRQTSRRKWAVNAQLFWMSKMHLPSTVIPKTFDFPMTCPIWPNYIYIWTEYWMYIFCDTNMHCCTYVKYIMASPCNPPFFFLFYFFGLSCSCRYS